MAPFDWPPDQYRGHLLEQHRHGALCLAPPSMSGSLVRTSRTSSYFTDSLLGVLPCHASTPDTVSGSKLVKKSPVSMYPDYVHPATDSMNPSNDDDSCAESYIVVVLLTDAAWNVPQPTATAGDRCQLTATNPIAARRWIHGRLTLDTSIAIYHQCSA